jgi:hypothetical protein
MPLAISRFLRSGVLKLKTNDRTSTRMYGISRIDDDLYNSHAWRVSLCRHGKKLVKNFPDKRFTGKHEALSKAIEFRDQLLLKYPPISRKEFCNAKRRNNKTGITGVYTYCKTYKLKNGEIKEVWYWEANWPDAVGESMCKSFSIKRYGEEIAKQMAIRARAEGMKKVEGTFWAAERGEVAVANYATSVNGLSNTSHDQISHVA